MHSITVYYFDGYAMMTTYFANRIAPAFLNMSDKGYASGDYSCSFGRLICDGASTITLMLVLFIFSEEKNPNHSLFFEKNMFAQKPILASQSLNTRYLGHGQMLY